MLLTVLRKKVKDLDNGQSQTIELLPKDADERKIKEIRMINDVRNQNTTSIQNYAWSETCFPYVVIDNKNGKRSTGVLITIFTI